MKQHANRGRPGMRAMDDGKSVLEESIEMFNKQWVTSTEDRHLKFFRSRDNFDKIRQGSTFESLVAEIDKAIAHWKSSDSIHAGHIVNGFNSVCKHLNAYKNLFAVVPQSSIWTSLFCGVTQMIIQV